MYKIYYNFTIMSDDQSIWTSDNVYLLGFLSSVLLSITPSIQMYALISKKISIHTISLFPLLCLYSNCGLFFFQQLLLILNNKEETTSLSLLNYCNLIGFCFGLIWCIIVIYYKNKKIINFVIFILLLIAATALAVAVEYLMKEMEIYHLLFNVIGSVFNVLMYLSSGFNTVNLFREKNFNYISILYVIVGFVNCVIWLIFGIAFGREGDNNVHIVIANAIGIALTLIQIIVYYMYRKEYIDKNSIRTTEAPLKIDSDIKIPEDIGDL